MDLTDTLDPTLNGAATPETETSAPRQSNDGSSQHQKEENKFQQAVASWRNIDLTNLIPTLDNAASELVTHQRDSLVQRKDLAQKTKDFRKLDDANKLNEVKGLLKAYQTYIDLVTNQSKSIHNAFLQVYTPLAEAPDPYPLLEASIDSLVTAEETLPRVTEENQQLQKTVNKLTSQLEETETRLEQERAARQDLEAARDEKIKSVEESWEAVLAEKQNNWEAKEKALEEKVERQDRLLKELKASYEVSQRLARGENAEEPRGATAAELEIVTSELDRTTMRLAEVEARNEQLRLELAQSASSTSASKPANAIEDDPAFLRLQSENSSLLRRLENARFEKDAERRKIAGSLRSLEREISTLKSDRDKLRQKIQQWADYEDLKRELEMLKSIEFATGDDEDADNDASAAAERDSGSAAKKKNDSLEQLLLARNKKLSSELTLLRVSHQDLQKRLETLQEELSTTNMELEKSRALAATLETDLEKVQSEAANAFPGNASVAGAYSSRYPHSSMRRGRPSSPTSSIISGFEGNYGSADSPGRSATGEPVYGAGSGMLPMITAQRDRYKRKNAELEQSLQKADQTVQSLRSEVQSLQRDNLNLYEKTRYVSTYNRSHQSTSGTAYGAGTGHTSIAVDDGFADSRYKPAYEANLSPFAAFRSRESSRALRKMSLPERAVFQITKMALATRLSRNLFALYCAGLHILVLVMLYYMGNCSTAVAKVVGTAAAAGPLKVANGGSGVDVEWHKEGFQEGG